MRVLPSALVRLVGELTKLPGVGEKTALRYAVGLLRAGTGRLQDLERALVAAANEIATCPRCFFWMEKEHCALCEDSNRTSSGRICVVRDAPDVIALEKFRVHPWNYHVLQGLLSPLGGVGPDQIRFLPLLSRIEYGEGSSYPIAEVILALDATVEGDATALFIQSQLSAKFPKLKITRTAMGLPAGSSVEYLDPSTLEHALNHRTPLGV